MSRKHGAGSMGWLLLAAAVVPTPALAQQTSILVQSTTSTQNTGLYEYLLPRFTAKTGIGVHVVAVGTGQAIKNAMNGDGDVLLVHDTPAERKFVADGYGVQRFDVMYNDFIVVGPPNDPAGIAGMKDTRAAFRKLADRKSLFASRGDNSGTHSKELALWKAAGVDPVAASGTWYRETGSGMGATLNTAVGMGAYALTDRGSWISFRNKGNYRIVIEGDPELFNQYGVILVNPAKFRNVKAKQGQAFVDWLLSDEGQAAIAGFKIEGQQLFFPNAREQRGQRREDRSGREDARSRAGQAFRGLKLGTRNLPVSSVMRSAA